VKVSVIILNWNGRTFLPECLDALAAQTYRDFETIIVDNGSTDGSAEYVRESYPWVRLVALAENTGFAGGNNRGLAEAGGEFIVTLNNDTRVVPEFLEELVRPVSGDPRIGMVAAKMRNYYTPEQIDAVGLKIGANGLGYNIGVGETDTGQYDGSPAFGPCGGAALYRRAMLEEVGFFDPDFFAYYEDFDLAWRGRLAGWGCAAAPRAVVYHVHSATSGEWSRFKVYQTHRNKWYVIVRNWPRGLLLKRLPAIISYDAAALLLALLKRRGGAAVRARLDVVKNLRRLLAQRREVQARSKLSFGEIEGLFSTHEGALRTFLRKLDKR
jgi:GT2 family glycosyltransferase